MKEFRIYVGMSEDHMIEVLHSGLRNDNVPETFPVRHVNSAGIYFPTRFIKIVPLSWVFMNHVQVSAGGFLFPCHPVLISQITIRPSGMSLCKESRIRRLSNA